MHWISWYCWDWEQNWAHAHIQNRTKFSVWKQLWSSDKHYSCVPKNRVALLLLSPDVSFLLYVVSSEDFCRVFHGTGQNISAFPAVHKQGTSQRLLSSSGLEKGTGDLAAAFTFPCIQHIFVRGALSAAEHSLPEGDKALLGLFLLETAFLGRRVPPAPRALMPN